MSNVTPVRLTEFALLGPLPGLGVRPGDGDGRGQQKQPEESLRMIHPPGLDRLQEMVMTVLLRSTNKNSHEL